MKRPGIRYGRRPGLTNPARGSWRKEARHVTDRALRYRAVTDTSGMQAVPVFLSTLRPYCFKPEVQVESECAAVTDPLSQQVPGPPGAAAFTNVYARHCSCSEHALRHTS